MKVEQFAKWIVGSVFGLGAFVVVVKHGNEIGQFLKGTSDALVGFGNGVASIGNA
jgi:hypothetical protein